MSIVPREQCETCGFRFHSYIQEIAALSAERDAARSASRQATDDYISKCRQMDEYHRDMKYAIGRLRAGIAHTSADNTEMICDLAEMAKGTIENMRAECARLRGLYPEIYWEGHYDGSGIEIRTHKDRQKTEDDWNASDAKRMLEGEDLP